LDIEHVKQELGITTTHLLGTFEHESEVDKLVSEIKSLSIIDRQQLLKMIMCDLSLVDLE
jgi:hypothetical protein